MEDKLVRGPLKDVPPEYVQLQLRVLSVTDVDHKRGEFQIMIWFRQKWTDERLEYNTETDFGCFPDNGRQGFTLDDTDFIWKPDIYILNQIDMKEVAGSFWIYPTGEVEYVRSLLLKVSCNMNLNPFPLDVQL